MQQACILVCDDEPAIRFAVRDYLEGAGYLLREAATASEAAEALAGGQIDLVLVDYMLPDGNALDLMAGCKDAGAAWVVLTGHGSIDLAVRAIQAGAEQFITKPVDLAALHAVVERALANQRRRRREDAARLRRGRERVDPFAGKSAAMQKLAEQARRAAAADSPVLLLGETGTGKGVLARWLHEQGPRAEEAFVDLNCAGLSRELLESELFGHDRGAFTGATSAKPGMFEVAHRGVVFLDEIGDMDALVQPKLLKVLEDKRFRRLGEVRDRQVDVRLLAATHRDLAELTRDNRFRNDLYFRISTLPLRLPPLRARPEDILFLAEQVLSRLSIELGRGDLSLADDAIRALQKYPWPGNLRELGNVLERAVMWSESPVLTAPDLLFEKPDPPAPAADVGLTLAEVERRHIELVLSAENGQVVRAAQRLGIPRSTLYHKLKQYGLG